MAVIGAGDGARCAVEALFGMGPTRHWSTAELDSVKRCDWYGSGIPGTCETFRAQQRDRYRRLASLLPRAAGENTRLRVRNVMAEVAPGFGDVVVNERRYDLAVLACGYERQRGSRGGEVVYIGNALQLKHPTTLRRPAGRRCGEQDDDPVHLGLCPRGTGKAGLRPRLRGRVLGHHQPAGLGACESVQRGLTSEHARPGPLSPDEDAVYQFVTMVARGYRGEPVWNPGAKAVAAS